MKLITIFISLFLLSACFSGDDASHPFSDAAQNLAARVNIAALYKGKENELRWWSYTGLNSSLRVTIVNESMFRDCAAMTAFNEQHAEMVQYLHCSDYSLGMQEQELVNLLVANLALDKQDISCPGEMDGEAGFVEGIYLGKWFGYQYETPAECKAQTVLQLIKSLEKFKASL